MANAPPFVLLLVVHLLLDCRCLRESRFHADDPMIERVLGLVRLPDVAAIFRQLSSQDDSSVERLEALRTELVLVGSPCCPPRASHSITVGMSFERLAQRREGRGAQEGVSAELKSKSGLAYVRATTWLGHRAYLSAVC